MTKICVLPKWNFFLDSEILVDNLVFVRMTLDPTDRTNAAYRLTWSRSNVQ